MNKADLRQWAKDEHFGDVPEWATTSELATVTWAILVCARCIRDAAYEIHCVGHELSDLSEIVDKAGSHS